MEHKCLGKGDASQTEACIRTVKQNLREQDFPHLKKTFQRYLDFQC